MTRIAVFGDTHGRLRLMLQLCRLWQRQHHVHLDAILQCGDLGFFPESLAADRATRRYAKRDPEELAFARFFRRPTPPKKDALLIRTLTGPKDSLDTVRGPVIWCNGNHEDFQRLEELSGASALTPVDAFGVVHYLRSGHMTQVSGVRIAAIGGAPEAEGYDAYRSVPEDACEQLIEHGNRSFDVLLAHASPRGIGGVTDKLGSARLRLVDELCQPQYHFYAHHKKRIAPAHVGATQCHWLNDVGFKRLHGTMIPYGCLEEGCMGILSWKGQTKHRFEVLHEEWMQEVTWSTWRHM